METTLKQRIFREPDGIRRGLFWVLFAAVWFCLYLFFSVLHDITVLRHMGALFATIYLLHAISESLPSDRQNVAGTIRIITIVYATVASVYIFHPI